MTLQARLSAYLSSFDAVTGGKNRDRIESAYDGLGLPRDVTRDMLSPKLMRFFPYYRLAADGGLLQVDAPTDARIGRLERILDIILETVAEENAGVIARMKQAGVTPYFLKGRELNTLCNGIPRVSGDVDILVSQDDLAQAQQTIEAIGYRQGNTRSRDLNLIHNVENPGEMRLNPLDEDRVDRVRRFHHQVHPYYRVIPLKTQDFDAFRSADDRTRFFISEAEGNLYLLTSIDLHFNLAVGVDEADYLDNPRSITLYGETVPFVASEIMLNFFAGRAYYEPLVLNQMNFRDAIDTVMLLHRFSDGLDWDHVLFFSKKYGIAAPLYYCLRHIGHLAPGLVAPETFEYLERVLLAQPELDLGDFLPKCFGVMKYGSNDSTAFRALMG